MRLHVENDNQVRVNMGEPIFTPGKIPFRANSQEKTYLMRVAEQTLFVGAVSMGNPHVVTVVDDIDTADVETLGPLLENHERFPERVNAGFMQVLSRNAIKLRVYERGAGETQACGSGACAAVAVGIDQGLLDEQVTVMVTGRGFTDCLAGAGSAFIDDGACDTCI